MIEIVLRRYRPSDRLEIYLASAHSKNALAENATLCSLQSAIEDDCTTYFILLGEGVAAKPVDWRRFSYDHDKVRALLHQCIKDNLKTALLFDVQSNELARQLEHNLSVALSDLTSIFDTKSVRCEIHDGDALVTIDGEYKNGERGQLMVRGPASPIA